MHRRFGFVVSICGMVFVLLPLSTVLRQPDFVMCTIGVGFIVIGTFFAIESVARKKK